jgi:hypothetical protein
VFLFLDGSFFVSTHSFVATYRLFLRLQDIGPRFGDQDAFGTWINKKTLHWTEAVTDLASVAKNNFPQSAYYGLQKALQQQEKWQLVQRVKKDIGMDFVEVERAISELFLPALFGDTYDDDDLRRSLASLPVKQACRLGTTT